MSEDYVTKKAELVLGGDLVIPKGYDNPLFEYRDGKPYFAVIDFGKCRARKRISDKGEFYLKPVGDRLDIERNGEPFLQDVSLKEMFCHSPDIAVISVGKDGEVLTTEEVLTVLKDYDSKMDLRGITLHGSEPCTKEHHLEVIKAVHELYPNLNLGVGSRDLSGKGIQDYLDAGANNFKITCQSLVDRVAKIIDSDTVTESVFNCLAEAVKVFGRSKVVCTMYMGLGESDEELEQVLDRMCSIGAMPDIKVKKLRDKTRGEIEAKLGKLETVTPERYAKVAKMSKAAMEKHGLDPSGYTTMCYGCRLCTIVPFKDF